MDLIQNLALGFGEAATLQNLLYCFLGVLLGTLIGVLPGVGPLTTIALLLPLTFNVPATASLIMLAGIYYGAQYGGSTTAILMNLPGEASSAVTSLDGYQMARQGRAGEALAIAAIGSFVAGSIATLVLAILATPLAAVAMSFGPAEYFSLMVLGLVTSIALAHGSLLSGMAMVVLGLLLGLVGTDIYSGLGRYTFGRIELLEGIDVVALAIGLFGIAEILRNLGHDQSRSVAAAKVSRLVLSLRELRAMTGPVLRGTAVGSILGILPGGGALLSSFAAYTVEKKLSRKPETFGHGAPAGVASPEAANNAGAQMSFVPMLTLGLPSNPVMALMIGALLIQGIAPGPNVANTNPELFWGLIASMWLGNLMLVVLNLPLVGLWVKLLNVPYRMLVPAIVAFSVVGIYSVDGSAFVVLTVSFFGALGYFFSRLNCEPAPLMLGFILGPLLEEHLRRAMLLSRGDPFIFVESPISAGLLVVSVVIVGISLLPAFSRKRAEIFVDESC